MKLSQIIIAALLLLTACSYVTPSKPMMMDGTTNAGDDSGKVMPEFVDFQSVYQMVLEPKCLHCHHAHPFLQTEEAFKAKCFDIEGEVFSDKKMPPKTAKPLTACENAVLLAYVKIVDGDLSPNVKISDLADCQ